MVWRCRSPQQQPSLDSAGWRRPLPSGTSRLSRAIRGSPRSALCATSIRAAVVFVQGTHVFEGLRWYRGRECAVITSTFAIPELPIYSQAQAQQPVQQAPTRVDSPILPSSS